MPLIKSSKKEAVGKNIKAELEAGKPRKQAVAIALNVQREAEKKPRRTTIEDAYDRHMK
jgi:hypothetical protein